MDRRPIFLCELHDAHFLAYVRNKVGLPRVSLSRRMIVALRDWWATRQCERAEEIRHHARE